MTPEPDQTHPEPVSSETVVVFTGGDALPPGVAEGLPAHAYVIAADSGLHHALALGRRVDLIVGDLDSVSRDALASAEGAGALVERHPVAKERTDLELALDRAIELGASRVVVLGGYGGRVDHFVANALLLAAPRYASVAVEARVGAARLFVVHHTVELAGCSGDLVTLLALGGPARGVTTVGLRYPLDGETLVPGSTRGVSNELVAERARVRLDDGVLLVIQPGALGASPGLRQGGTP
jgi:thiamine pyrophosphokinase